MEESEHDSIRTFATGYFQKEMTFQFNAVDVSRRNAQFAPQVLYAHIVAL